jgi:hypothetical protein
MDSQKIAWSPLMSFPDRRKSTFFQIVIDITRAFRRATAGVGMTGRVTSYEPAGLEFSIFFAGPKMVCFLFIVDVNAFPASRRNRLDAAQDYQR